MPREHTTVRDSHALLHLILQRIQSGIWPEGYRLPSERALAEEYDLARNTVRSALHELETAGWLERRVGRGTFVRLPARLGVDGLLGNLREASPADLMEVRLIIEPPVAALAATRASRDDLLVIESALRSSLAATGIAEFEQWDARLHLAIFVATRNSVLIDYCKALNAARNQPRWYRLKQRTLTPELRSLYDRQHSRLVDHLRERDAEAARRALHEHLVTVRDHLLGAD